ncbi:MAG: hypothetical protein ABSF82_14355 [Candidatus Bathyarchaeia archaeon]
MTSLGRRMRVNTVKLMLSTVSFLHSAGVALRGFVDYIRSCLVTAALSSIYFLIVTPIAWRRRGRLRMHTNEWKDWRGRTGWHTNEQSTSDPQIYTNLSSNLHDLEAKARQDGDYWMPVLNDMMLALRPLVEPPKEKELSTDLYVMF